MIIINILTRTSNRPNYFDINYNSVKSQILPENIIVNHIVSYDDEPTFKYLEKYKDIIKVAVDKEHKTATRTFPVNIYFNELHKYVKDGFIMYLDDDDSFYDNNSLAQLIPYLDETKIVFWQVQFPDKIIPADYIIDSKKVIIHNCPSNSFIYHYSLLNKYGIQWPPKRGGDYKFIHSLFKAHKNGNWLKLVLTKVPQSGFGLQMDK